MILTERTLRRLVMMNDMMGGGAMMWGHGGDWPARSHRARPVVGRACQIHLFPMMPSLIPSKHRADHGALGVMALGRVGIAPLSMSFGT